MDICAIYNKVQEHYSSVVTGNKKHDEKQIATALGYSAAELDSIPTASNLGLACGYQLAIASLKEVTASICHTTSVAMS